jgi:hypothetical protein
MARKSSLNAQFFVSRVETLLQKAGHDGGLEGVACRLLTGPDLEAAASVCIMLMSYKYGLSRQTVEHALTEADLRQVQETVQRHDDEAKEVGKAEDVKAVKDVVN